MRKILLAVLAVLAWATLAAGGVVVPLAAQTGVSATPAAPRSATLARRIDGIVERAPLDRAHWGIEVLDPATGQVLYGRNADKLFIPASNLKLVVSAAAAHLLGPDFRYRTTVHGTGPLRDGVLHGDLVLYGRGDPTLSGRYADQRTEALEALADSLRPVAFGASRDRWWPTRATGTLRTCAATGRSTTSSGGTRPRSARSASTTTRWTSG